MKEAQRSQRRKQRLEKTEPKPETNDTQQKMIKDIKSEGERLTEKQKLIKVLLKKLQKI